MSKKGTVIVGTFAAMLLAGLTLRENAAAVVYPLLLGRSHGIRFCGMKKSVYIANHSNVVGKVPKPLMNHNK